eukprot:12113125-Prorocentrum_lima.AAC.1
MQQVLARPCRRTKPPTSQPKLWVLRCAAALQAKTGHHVDPLGVSLMVVIPHSLVDAAMHDSSNWKCSQRP